MFPVTWVDHHHVTNSRLHFLWQLKRAAVSCKDMLRFYIAIICLVVGYAAHVWHTGLTAELEESLKSVQKRVLIIIFGGNCFTDSTYLPFCDSLTISSLQCRRETLPINVFQKILKPSSCLHYLISSQLKKLRNHLLYSSPFTRTIKFKSSLLVHALYHYV